MRSGANREKLLAFVEAIGRSAASAGCMYLVGGSTSLLLGIRDQTIDIDIKLDPEPGGVFEAISRLKETLDLNIELASPDQFVPALPGWRERSEYVGRFGLVDVYHYDFYSQAIAKIKRGNETDLLDVRQYVALGKVDLERLLSLYQQVRSAFIRYPQVDLPSLDRHIQAFVDGIRESQG